jgi:hypothetical protein
MRFRTLVAASAAASLSLSALATAASASNVLFDSLNGETAPAALQMEIDVVPEPSTWAMMVVGFAGLTYVGYRRAKMSRAA